MHVLQGLVLFFFLEPMTSDFCGWSTIDVDVCNSIRAGEWWALLWHVWFLSMHVRKTYSKSFLSPQSFRWISKREIFHNSGSYQSKSEHDQPRFLTNGYCPQKSKTPIAGLKLKPLQKKDKSRQYQNTKENMCENRRGLYSFDCDVCILHVARWKDYNPLQSHTVMFCALYASLWCSTCCKWVQI